MDPLSPPLAVTAIAAAVAVTSTVAATVVPPVVVTIDWAQVALYAWPLLAVVVRPFLPPKVIEALGPLGKLLEAVCGNWGHAKNAPKV